MNKLFVLILLLVALFGSTEALNKHHKKHSATKKHSITKVAKAEQHATTKSKATKSKAKVKNDDDMMGDDFAFAGEGESRAHVDETNMDP